MKIAIYKQVISTESIVKIDKIQHLKYDDPNKYEILIHIAGFSGALSLQFGESVWIFNNPGKKMLVSEEQRDKEEEERWNKTYDRLMELWNPEEGSKIERIV